MLRCNCLYAKRKILEEANIMVKTQNLGKNCLY